jgi:hypothetical protein
MTRIHPLLLPAVLLLSLSMADPSGSVVASAQDLVPLRQPVRSSFYPESQQPVNASVSPELLQPPAINGLPGMSPGMPGSPDSSPQNASSLLTVQTGTQKVPAGTMLSISFNTLLDSRITNTGDPFTVYLNDNFTSTTPDGRYPKVILPSGTMIRGRVSTVSRPSFFSKGGSLFLAFDHIVLPSGELLPIQLNLSTENKLVNRKGAIYSDPGMKKKMQQGVQTGQQTFGHITDQGYAAGSKIAGGLGSIVTVPASVIGGAVAGSAVTTARVATAIVGKGESAVINPGDEIKIDFGGSFNLPSE